MEIIGPENYQQTMQEANKQGLIRPTSAQIISILEKAIEKQDKFHREILNIFDNNYLWTCTEHIFLPKSGIIIYNNINGQTPEISELENLTKKNKEIRFIPYGFKTGNMSIEDFLSNPLIINHFGENHMETVGKVVQYFGNKPYVSALSQTTKPERKFCAILRDKNENGFALHGKGAGTGDKGYSIGL